MILFDVKDIFLNVIINNWLNGSSFGTSLDVQCKIWVLKQKQLRSKGTFVSGVSAACPLIIHNRLFFDCTVTQDFFSMTKVVEKS